MLRGSEQTCTSRRLNRNALTASAHPQTKNQKQAEEPESTMPPFSLQDELPKKLLEEAQCFERNRMQGK